MHNIAENDLNSTISEVELCIFVIHVHSEFQLKMFMNDRDNEYLLTYPLRALTDA